jgi:Putative 2OG-Fe(II) oxygenase
VFPTPVGQYRVEAAEASGINDELRRIILERECREASQSFANAGGWHSKQDLLEWPDGAVGTLRTWIREAVDHAVVSAIQVMHGAAGRTPDACNLVFKAWANVSRRGNFHRLHNHPRSCWSGVYYVSSCWIRGHSPKWWRRPASRSARSW